MSRRIALDTGALIALASPRDQYHLRAREQIDRVTRNRQHLIGTTLVLAELHRYVAQALGPKRGLDTLTKAADDPRITWVEVTHSMVLETIARWLAPQSHPSYTLTDAATFELMRREGIDTAFAFDQHFVAAGFRLLP
ncbi:MAG: PIN domain-containing protein [Gemmatimonadales bacterium]